MIIGCDDVPQLEENVAVARAFSPMPEAEMRALEQATKSYKADAAWFKKAGTGFSASLFDDQNTE